MNYGWLEFVLTCVILALAFTGLMRILDEDAHNDLLDELWED